MALPRAFLTVSRRRRTFADQGSSQCSHNAFSAETQDLQRHPGRPRRLAPPLLPVLQNIHAVKTVSTGRLPLTPGTHHRKSSTQTEYSYRNYPDAPGELPTFWLAIHSGRQTVDRERYKALIYKPRHQDVVALAAAQRCVRPRNTGPLRCVGLRLKREGCLPPL